MMILSLIFTTSTQALRTYHVFSEKRLQHVDIDIDQEVHAAADNKEHDGFDLAL